MNPFRRLRWSVVATLIVAVTLVRATATIAQSAFPQRLMAPLEPFSGNGSMFSYEATALAPGVAPLPITYAKASDVDANEIPLNITESVLEIEPAMESIAAQGPKPVHDASPAWLSVVPAHAQPEIGDIITVCATISQVEGLYAHDIRLSYIPEVIEVLDANPAYDGVQVWPATRSYQISRFAIV